MGTAREASTTVRVVLQLTQRFVYTLGTWGRRSSKTFWAATTTRLRLPRCDLRPDTKWVRQASLNRAPTGYCVFVLSTRPSPKEKRNRQARRAAKSQNQSRYMMVQPIFFLKHFCTYHTAALIVLFGGGCGALPRLFLQLPPLHKGHHVDRTQQHEELCSTTAGLSTGSRLAIIRRTPACLTAVPRRVRY